MVESCIETINVGWHDRQPITTTTSEGLFVGRLNQQRRTQYHHTQNSHSVCVCTTAWNCDNNKSQMLLTQHTKHRKLKFNPS